MTGKQGAHFTKEFQSDAASGPRLKLSSEAREDPGEKRGPGRPPKGERTVEQQMAVDANTAGNPKDIPLLTKEDWSQFRYRQDRAKAHLAELELEKARGQLLSLDEVMQLADEMSSIYLSVLQQVPDFVSELVAVDKINEAKLKSAAWVIERRREIEQSLSKIATK